MAPNDDQLIRVTLEETQQAEVAAPAPLPSAPAAAATGVAKNYGNINAAEPAAPVTPEQKGSFMLQGWFYLGAAGLLGATAGWGIAEPAFADGGNARWGNYLLMVLVVTFMCMGFSIAESIAERSVRKAFQRLVLSIPLGLVLGFAFDMAANMVYSVGLNLIYAMGIQDHHNPGWWIARGIGWMAFGVAGGLVYGIVGRSSKKGKYGVIGGMIGAGLGGVIFDPISFAFNSGTESRAVGFALFGLATGLAMGFVESALKDRWLYVSSGPLAGKQFILYKAQTFIGSSQSSDIYLFKDASIEPQHASIEFRGPQAWVKSVLPIYVSGIPTRSSILRSGDLIQIGRYGFHYHERHSK